VRQAKSSANSKTAGYLLQRLFERSRSFGSAVLESHVFHDIQEKLCVDGPRERKYPCENDRAWRPLLLAMTPEGQTGRMPMELAQGGSPFGEMNQQAIHTEAALFGPVAKTFGMTYKPDQRAWFF
jgi:hypothetical protein